MQTPQAENHDLQERLGLSDQQVIDMFHILWYSTRSATTWHNTHWFGIDVQQCPMDMWVYMEILNRTRPEVFVEIGVKAGGLTRYICHMFDLLYGYKDIDAGRHVGVDIRFRKSRRKAITQHKRVTLIEGDSVAQETFEQVRELVGGRRAMVLLDSDHTEPHVRKELELYQHLVAPGCYLIINDSNINGHPALPGNKGRGGGPYEAVEDFLATSDDFELDMSCEKHMVTLCPHGYLRRKGAGDVVTVGAAAAAEAEDAVSG
jgi:cephalosporin hydroxylase